MLPAFGASLIATSLFAGELTHAQFRADSNLVLINATVLDPQNRPVRGLTRDRFRIFEGKREQTIVHFAEEDAPLSIAFVLDLSGSMDGKLRVTRSAMQTIVGNTELGDELALITFADRVRVAAPWTTTPEEIQSHVLFDSAHGRTALIDAVENAVCYMKKASYARKAIVIFSDGGENWSHFAECDVLRLLEEADIAIYAVDATETFKSRALSLEEFGGPDLLERLCDHSGGRYFHAGANREVAAAAQQISRELHSQYLIGYVPPSDANDGRFHHVRVQVKREEGDRKLGVFWRRGYRAPPQ